GLAVDVEKNDIGVGGNSPLNVREEHGVLHLALKEFDGLSCLSVVRMRPVSEQVRNDLQEVRLPGTEEARNPDAHLAVWVRVLSFIDRFQVPADELAEVLVEF